MKRTLYEWRTPLYGRLSAQKVGEYLEHLRQKKQLTPKSVVEDARKKSSPIHRCFEWNDGRAADLYRLQQARTLLGNVEVIIKERHMTEPAIVRAFVHLKSKDAGDRSQYVSVKSALRNPKLRQKLLDEALSEITSWRRRYSELKELARIFEAIDVTADNLEAVAS